MDVKKFWRADIIFPCAYRSLMVCYRLHCSKFCRFNGGYHCGRHMSGMRERPAQRQQGEPFEQQDQKDVKTELAVREGGRTSRFSCTHARMHALHPLRQGKKGQLTV